MKHVLLKPCRQFQEVINERKLVYSDCVREMYADVVNEEDCVDIEYLSRCQKAGMLQTQSYRLLSLSPSAL